jgi:hypothetical protein
MHNYCVTFYLLSYFLPENYASHVMIFIYSALHNLVTFLWKWQVKLPAGDCLWILRYSSVPLRAMLPFVFSDSLLIIGTTMNNMHS